MKHSSLFFTFLLMLLTTSGFGQPLFQAITEGPLVTSPSDSRSVNWVDVNQDGWEDIFISNGPKGGQNNQLFLNNGDGSFREVSNDPIVLDNSPSDGASFADMDNDGDLDAYVVTWYGVPNLLYENTGKGKFQLLDQALPSQVQTYSETAAWGDPNGDGRLDLFVTNSTDFNTNSPEVQRNYFFQQDEKGNLLSDSTAWMQSARISRSVNWIDYDLDGDSDLFIANEENQSNQLYENIGNGRMVLQDNILNQDTLASISSSWADVDNDGDLDLFVSNWLRQPNQLFYNEGKGQFKRVLLSPEGEDGGCTFGSAFGDADNDGDLDLFLTNAFCRGTLKNFYYQNDGQGHFSRDTTTFPDLTTVSSYGVAWGDANNDGQLDLMVANCTPHPAIPQPTNSFFLNQGNSNHWLKIKLRGDLSNRSAIGALIHIKTIQKGKPHWQMREVSSQSAYCGQNSLTQHFGLGESITVDSLIVYWPSGLQSNMTSVEADQTLVLSEASQITEDSWQQYLNHKTHPLSIQDSVSNSDLTFLKEQLTNKKIVLLGEFTHGAKEINLLKNRLIQYLHTELGYNLLLFESGPGEIYSMNYHRAELPFAKMLYSGLIGPWHTKEFFPLMQFIQQNTKLHVGGFDPQRSGRSFGKVLDELLSKINPKHTPEGSGIESVFSDITKKLKGKTLGEHLLARRDSLQNAYFDLIQLIQKQRPLLQKEGYPAVQIATIELSLRNRIAYLDYYVRYKTDYRARFAARDSIMAENIRWFSEQFPNEKIIISAHNYHISKYNEKEAVMGEWLHRFFGEQLYSIGIFAGSGIIANNSRKPEAMEQVGNRMDIKRLIQLGKWQEVAFIDMQQAQKSVNNAWMFNRLQVDGFVNLNNGKEIIPRKWFDGLLLLREVSMPVYTY